MCLIAAAARRKLRPEKLSGLTKGVAGVICFPFSSAVLIDDHSLFHGNTLLLSRVHYSERSNAGEERKGGRGGGSRGKRERSLCALHKVRGGKGPSLHYRYMYEKENETQPHKCSAEPE